MRAAALLLTLLPIVGLEMPALAQMPTDLVLPIDCEPGATCWILQYVDHDPGPGVRDYRCGEVAGDGHSGTDFAIRDLAAMTAGVEVRAAAAGVVEALRDGVPDVSVDVTGLQAVEGRECGNGIRIAHDDGWTTSYCHLRRGSLMIAEGDRIAAGQPLALVGHSGAANFPHLHFEVRRAGQVVDPFVGLEPGAPCAAGTHPLWRADVMAGLAYQPVVLTNAGIAPTPPQMEDAQRGYHNRSTLAVTSRVLEVWAEGYGLEAGDRAHFELTGPGGAPVVDRWVELDRSRANWFQFIGARRPGAAWPAGSYAGKVTLERAGAATMTLERRVELR